MARLQGYCAAAECEVGDARSQPRGKYQSLAQIEGLRVGMGKEIPPFPYISVILRVENRCKAHVTVSLLQSRHVLLHLG